MTRCVNQFGFLRRTRRSRCLAEILEGVKEPVRALRRVLLLRQVGFGLVAATGLSLRQRQSIENLFVVRPEARGTSMGLLGRCDVATGLTDNAAEGPDPAIPFGGGRQLLECGGQPGHVSPPVKHLQPVAPGSKVVAVGRKVSLNLVRRLLLIADRLLCPRQPSSRLPVGGVGRYIAPKSLDPGFRRNPFDFGPGSPGSGQPAAGLAQPIGTAPSDLIGLFPSLLHANSLIRFSAAALR